MTGAGGPDDRSNFEVIRDALLEMDPGTRHEVIETMKVLQEMPTIAAVRVLAEYGGRANMLRSRPVLVSLSGF